MLAAPRVLIDAGLGDCQQPRDLGGGHEGLLQVLADHERVAEGQRRWFHATKDEPAPSLRHQSGRDPNPATGRDTGRPRPIAHREPAMPIANQQRARGRPLTTSSWGLRRVVATAGTKAATLASQETP